jgi:hypothetical protein
MKAVRLAILGLAAAGSIATSANAATPINLTFDTSPTTCQSASGVKRACTFNGDLIAKDYGSTAEVAVSYKRDVGFTTFDQDHLLYIVENAGTYSGLGTNQVIFTPISGFEISLESFRARRLFTGIGDYSFSLRDSIGNTIYSLNTMLPSNGAEQTFVVGSNWFFGPLTFVVGNAPQSPLIDNLMLNVRAAAGPPTGAIPEPASWAMMIIGFGLVGSAARRRTKQLQRA